MHEYRTANVAITITWRLAYGVENPDEPEGKLLLETNQGVPNFCFKSGKITRPP